MKSALIIYDDSGNTWGISFGIEEVPAGIQGVIAQLPDNVALETVMVDPDTEEVTYQTYKTISEVDAESVDMALALVELDTRLRRIENG